MEKFLFYFLLFLIYSMAGWLMELVVVGLKEKKLIDRGFLIGPYCPIYGTGAIIMILYLNNYKDNVITVFLLATFICTFVEYIISFIMEKLFNARWWDYSDRKFNINGRVCLTNAFLFGVLGVLLIYFINPFLTDVLLNANTKWINVISTIWLVIFVSDYILSMVVTFNIKNKINKLKKDNTEEFNRKIRETIENKILNRRIFKAYPKFKINIIGIKEIKVKLDEKAREIKEKIEKI